MIFEVYVGRAETGRTMVHGLAWPGLVSVADSRDEALARTPLAIGRYSGWCAFHRGAGPAPGGKINVSIAEEVDVPGGHGDSEAVGTFGPDLAPLDEAYRESCLARLGWAFEDLMELAEGLRPEKLAWVPPGKSRSLEEELRHVGRGWWWYLTRLELDVPDVAGPGTPAGRALTEGRELFERRLRALSAVELSAEHVPATLVERFTGERWTARKVARRSVEHAMEHLLNLYSHLSLGSGEES